MFNLNFIEMKFIIPIILIFLTSTCKSNLPLDNETTSSYNDMILEYAANSRAFHLNIKINKKLTLVLKSRNGESIQKNTSNSNWTIITGLVKKMDIQKLSSLEPPSKNHEFDGAHLAHLTISNGNAIYETQTFDHGNPPSEISELVKEMLSIAENIE